jgi:alpha-tubulin suppressor-like RCC1 family protein
VGGAYASPKDAGFELRVEIRGWIYAFPVTVTSYVEGTITRALPKGKEAAAGQTVVLESGGAEVARIQTQSDGRYRFASLPAGSYTVRPSTPAAGVILPGSASFALGPGAPTGTANFTEAVWTTVESGDRFTCGLLSTGDAYCWGLSTSGQLGNGSTATLSTPAPVADGLKFQDLAVGYSHACGLTLAGAAYCWGYNATAQLGIGSTATPVMVPTAVSGGITFTQLSASLVATCGLATSGAAYCWGRNSPYGVIGIGNATTPAIVLAPAEVVGSAALGLVSVHAGYFAACGLSATGEAWCWGYKNMLGNGTTTDSYVPVRAASSQTFTRLTVGNQFICGLSASGTSSCWGERNVVGEQGHAGGRTLTPLAIAGAPTFASIKAGHSNYSLPTTCAVTPSGDAYCWGNNKEGQLGATTSQICSTGFASPLNTAPCSTTPVPVSGGLKFSSVSVGLDHVCGVTVEGNVYCWGRNDYGEIGIGVQDAAIRTPVRVIGPG